ncbi:hypothetical protein ACFL6U_15375 [Planctomycetota bacterium]
MKDKDRQIDRYLDGTLDENEIKELFTWLAESQQHAEVFARQSLLDQQLTELLDSGFVKPIEATLEKSTEPETVHIAARSWRRSQRLVWAGGLAAACLMIFLAVMALMRSQEVADLKHELELARQDVALARRDIPLAQQEAAVASTDNSATINLYLEEHRDFIARHASYSSATPQPVQMRVSRDDILYYESFDDGPEYRRPGIIVRGPSSDQEIESSGDPVISNGHTLPLSEARQAADFNLVAPPWLRPAYALDQIRRIEGRDALQLLYTDGINSVSLFEQPLDGQRGLEPQDFREYAVYRNTRQTGGTILAWKDDELSYVLIGNIEMSQLMDMAQSISAAR